jgi:hypothetical protein
MGDPTSQHCSQKARTIFQILLVRTYNQRRREEAELLAELDQLKRLWVNPKQIHILSDAMLQSWIDKMGKALEGDTAVCGEDCVKTRNGKIVLYVPAS